MELNKINEEIKNCELCSLCETRNNTVPGYGKKDANILFIGEAPGFNEDKQGKPFVGRAGKILDRLLEHIGLNREDVFITNIVKCRPPNNRDPTTEEIRICTPHLDKQIEVIKPKVIVALGRHSMKYIFNKFNIDERGTISQIHGKEYRISTLFGDKTIIPLFHPAVATYSPTKIDVLKKDFETLKKFV